MKEYITIIPLLFEYNNFYIQGSTSILHKEKALEEVQGYLTAKINPNAKKQIKFQKFEITSEYELEVNLTPPKFYFSCFSYSPVKYEPIENLQIEKIETVKFDLNEAYKNALKYGLTKKTEIFK